MFSGNTQAILERDFILTKIDTDRYEGGPAILKGLNPKPGGIPWFVFLEPDAKPATDETSLGAQSIGDANIMKGNNVGSPYTAEEIAAFGALLRKVSVNLDDEAFKQLHKSLLAQGEKKKA